MLRAKVERYQSFVDANGNGGNPAGVLEHSGVTSEQMQQIAAKVNVPETAFVEHVANGTKHGCYRALYCTPNGSFVPLCGHATVALGHHLFERHPDRERFTVQYERDGMWHDTEVQKHGDFMYYRHDVPKSVQGFDPTEIAQVLGIDENEIDYTRFQPTSVAGDGLLGVTPHGLSSITPEIDMGKLATALQRKDTDLFAVHVFALDESGGDIVAHARDFAPPVGIPEEAATGSATACLAKQLIEQGTVPVDTFASPKRFVQGEAMGMASDIYVLLENQEILVGGRVLHQKTEKIQYA